MNVGHKLRSHIDRLSLLLVVKDMNDTWIFASCAWSTIMWDLVLILVGFLFSLPLVSANVGDFLGASDASEKLINVTFFGSSTTGAQLELLYVVFFGLMDLSKLWSMLVWDIISSKSCLKQKHRLLADWGFF